MINVNGKNFRLDKTEQSGDLKLTARDTITLIGRLNCTIYGTDEVVDTMHRVEIVSINNKRGKVLKDATVTMHAVSNLKSR
jgi:hypothetical protein